MRAYRLRPETSEVRAASVRYLRRLNMVMKNNLLGGMFGWGPFGGGQPTGGGTPSTAPLLPGGRRYVGGGHSMLEEGYRVGQEEDRRFAEQSGFLGGQFDAFNKDFADSERGLSSLQFSAGADEAGGQAREGVNRLMGLLGSRGLSPSSGTALDLASRILMQQQGQVVGARRDVALDAARRRQIQRAQQFANAMGLTNFRNQSPSMVPLDTMTNMEELAAAKYGVQAGERAANKKSKNDLLGTIIGGGLSLIGGLI